MSRKIRARTIYVRDDELRVNHDATDNALIKLIPGHSYDSTVSEWVFPVRQIEHVVKGLPHYGLDSSAIAKLDELQTSRQQVKKDWEAFTDTGELNPALLIHQKRVVNVAIERARRGTPTLAVFMDTGTGKTFTMLEIIKQLNPLRVLVVCPTSLVKAVWENEVKKWYPDLDVRALWRPTGNRGINALDTALRRQGQIHVVNFATFRTIAPTLIKAQGVNGNGLYDMLIVDESSIMKDHTSKTTAALLDFGKTVRSRFILSGCPAPNSPLEYFAQIKLIDDTILGPSFGNFCSRWFRPKWGGVGYEIKEEEREAMMAEIARVSIFIKKDECLDLPPLTVQVREVQMNEAQEKVYLELRDHLASKLDDSYAVVPNGILAKLMKLRQVTSGFIKPTDLLDDDEGPDDAEELDRVLKSLGIRPMGETPNNKPEMIIKDLSDTKLKALMEILEDELHDQQAIIWCQFIHEFELIHEALDKAGITHGLMYGETDKRQMAAIENDFLQGKSRVIVAHPRSVAHGHTWVNASYDIVFSLSYSYEEWKQSGDRIHRMGQTKACTRIVLASTLRDGSESLDHLLLVDIFESILKGFLRGVKCDDVEH